MGIVLIPSYIVIHVYTMAIWGLAIKFPDWCEKRKNRRK
jgi:hypothetical protein